jgi:hypothetical protein
MKYLATCTAQGTGVAITFRDLPEATSEADDVVEALSKGLSVLRKR